MSNKNEKIIIQSTTEDSINVEVNGEIREIAKKIDALLSLMKEVSSKSIQSADKIYNIGTITNANFNHVIGQAIRDKILPKDLNENLITDNKGWIQSIRHELQQRQGIAVGNRSWDIFQNYGWLIEAFLQKLHSSSGEEKSLRRLSFMSDVWQSSLRYLCYIQIAQIMQLKDKPRIKILSDFLQMDSKEFIEFDYTSLLLTTAEAIGENNFMIEINDFLEELKDSKSSLFQTLLYLEDKRNKLIKGVLVNNDNLNSILEEYLTALVFWLRKISFVSKYRMVSIKEINLDYKLGTNKYYVHLYGELHGIYAEVGLSDEDYNSISIEDAFTFNKSVLLFRGVNLNNEFENLDEQNNYLSLSPLIIDQSVYSGRPTQTPEIFYFTGYDDSKKHYNFSQYKNELVLKGEKDLPSNKYLKVATQNNNQYLLDTLFEQLKNAFEPLKYES